MKAKTYSLLVSVLLVAPFANAQDDPASVAAAVKADPANAQGIVARAVASNLVNADAIAAAAIAAAPAQSVGITSAAVAAAPAKAAAVVKAAVTAAPDQAGAVAEAAVLSAFRTTSVPALEDQAMAKIAAAAVAAAPSQAPALAAALIVAAPGQAASMINAVVSGAPNQAAEIAKEAITADPSQAALVAQTAAAAAPSQAAAVTQAAIEAGPNRGTVEKEKVLAEDTKLIDALLKRDAKQLDSIVADDVYSFNGGAWNDEQTGREAFSKRVESGRIPASETLTYHVARIYGATGDVAIVHGTLKDKASTKEKPRGENYTSIYTKADDGAWKLVRFHNNPNASVSLAGETEVPPNTSGSLDSLKPEERVVAEHTRLFLDLLARAYLKEMELLTVNDWVIISAQLGGGGAFSGKEYISNKWLTPPAGPEMIALFNPHVLICGKDRDVAIINVGRTDATGGCVFGVGFNPIWRSVSNQLLVWIRTSASSADWRLVHLHGASYVPKPH